MRRNKQYTEEDMEQALREIMEGQPIYRSSKKFNIPVSSLIERMKSLNIILAPTNHSPSKQQRGMDFVCGICNGSFDDEEALFEHLRRNDHDGIDSEEENDDNDVGSRESSSTIDPFEATDE